MVEISRISSLHRFGGYDKIISHWESTLCAGKAEAPLNVCGCKASDVVGGSIQET